MIEENQSRKMVNCMATSKRASGQSIIKVCIILKGGTDGDTTATRLTFFGYGGVQVNDFPTGHFESQALYNQTNGEE